MSGFWSTDVGVTALVVGAWLLGTLIGYGWARLSADERHLQLARSWREEASRRLELEAQLEALLPASDEPISLNELWDAADDAELVDNAGAAAWLELLRRDIGRSDG